MCLFTHDSITFKRRIDLEHPYIESIWIEIQLTSFNILICNIYRHPKSSNSWYSSFTEMLDSAWLENKNIILMGDFNIDLLEPQDSWNDIFNSFNLTQIISLPTRVTPTHSSLIDHIYTNNIDLISEICVPLTGLSDHYPVSCTINKCYFKF